MRCSVDCITTTSASEFSVHTPVIMVVYETINWFGLVAPAGTRPAIVERLHREIAAVQELPEVRKQFDADGATVMRMSPAEFGAYMIADLKKWERVVKEGGIKPE
jgi:tripartite-type tricarboxylate transporter receptor subunit TctC